MILPRPGKKTGFIILHPFTYEKNWHGKCQRIGCSYQHKSFQIFLLWTISIRNKNKQLARLIFVGNQSLQFICRYHLLLIPTVYCTPWEAWIASFISGGRPSIFIPTLFIYWPCLTTNPTVRPQLLVATPPPSVGHQNFVFLSLWIVFSDTFGWDSGWLDCTFSRPFDCNFGGR